MTIAKQFCVGVIEDWRVQLCGGAIAERSNIRGQGEMVKKDNSIGEDKT